MAFFNNKRKDFSIQPPRQQVDGTPFFVTDSANIDFTLENLNLTADLTPTGVTSGTYGSPTLIPILQVDQWGRITGVTTTPFSASGISLETNGTPNPVQTLLNLVAGTNMTITDDGLGNITFDATGGGGTYTVDNGLTESPANNFQLGGSLIQNTIITSTGFKLDLISNVNFPGYALGVQNSGTGSGIFVQSVGGNGAIDAINNNGTGVVGTSSNGYGIRAVSNGNGTAFQAAQTKSTTNVVETIAQLFRETSSLGANGIGGSLDFYVETDNSSSIPLSHKLISKWTNATFASRVSQFEIEGVNNAITSRLFALTGAGQLILDKYGQSPANFPGTPTYALGVDASGNVVEFTASPTTGDSISPFLLMGG
jgi:hypothetical protein